MTFHFDIPIGGRYKLEAIRLDSDGKEISRRTLADWFPNLIVDQGLDRFGASGTLFSHCRVGTGNTAPANTDTSLVSQVWETSTINATSGTTTASSPYYSSRVNTYRFAAAPSNQNLSEIGVGWADVGGTLFSRALILDGGGSPTTITVLTGEILDATYEFRVYSPTTDVSGSISISSVSYSYTLRAALASTNNTPGWPATASVGQGVSISSNGLTNSVYSGAIGAVTGTPAGTIGTGASSVSNSAYSNGSYYRDATLTYDLSSGNLVGGFRSMLFVFTLFCFQIEFSPNIPKTNTSQFTLTGRLTFTRAVIP